MRSFVSLHFFLRFSIFLGAVFSSDVLYWFFQFLLFGGSSLLIAVVQPYKKVFMNITDILILAILSLFGVFYILYLRLGPDNSQHSMLFLIAFCLNFTLPLFGITVIIILKMLQKRIPTSWVHQFNRKFCTASGAQVEVRIHHNETQVAQQTFSGATVSELELPDCMLHPYRYVEEGSDETPNGHQIS